MRSSVKRVLAATVITTVAIGLAGCSGGDQNTGGDATSIEDALEKGGSLTYWAWAPSSEAQVAAFEKAYPNVDVTLVNAGSGVEEYTKLQNTIQAGKGAPDVAQLEDTAISQFALSESLVDLSTYGIDELEDEYTVGTWSSVAIDDGVYGLPQDSGPMSLYYNKRVFDQYGIAVPTTWDEYVEAAKTLHEADPSTYLTSDNGDGLFASSLIWQAGGRPFEVDGTKVTINLQDEGTLKWTKVWNELVEGELLAPTPAYSDAWYKQLASGQIASLISAAWLPSLLQTAAADGAGDWQAAPMPTYDGTPASANYGGSSQVVIEQSEQPALAAAFVKWLNNSPESIKLLIDSGSFPSTTADIDSPALLDLAPDYFAGQEINKVAQESGESVSEGWEYLPFQVYAQTIFPDTVGQSYANNTDLNEGLKDWQDALVEYGNEQGFDVTVGK
ncbi:MAG: sugar transporter substrate-binding protein [Glaciihabitans sp.]|nr:sugar transporter substrate-binding protein [Glaciihabitans sp.]